jgi:mannose-6-phosphate isomerase-like protein (cupin superfamily)
METNTLGGAMIRSRDLLALAILSSAQLAAAGTQAMAHQPSVQTPPPAAAVQAPPAAPKPQAPATAVAQRASMTLAVTDLAGEAAPGVHVVLTGPVAREGTTGRDGGLRFQALRPGTYRLRFESPEFITFEREVAVKTGPPVDLEVSLARAPEKPAPPPPPPPPTPAVPRDAAPVMANANPAVELLSLPDWIEKNLIGRSDPQKETVVGRTTAATARVVQVRDPMKDRVRADADEMLYVIAGEGVLRANGREYDVDAGSLAVIPRGVTYSLERRGRNPLIALSMAAK